MRSILLSAVLTFSFFAPVFANDQAPMRRMSVSAGSVPAISGTVASRPANAVSPRKCSAGNNQADSGKKRGMDDCDCPKK
jgi:hypothetical protein